MWQTLVSGLAFLGKGVVLASVVVCMVLLLGACSYKLEGAGFSNTGKPSRPACLDTGKSTLSHQVWKTC